MESMRTKFIFTIGHSTHSQQEFIDILKAFDVRRVVDIRSLPGSRYCPQFNQEEMQIYLPKNKIEYIHFPDLGGRRKGKNKTSVNLAWRSLSFRNYADYMQTLEFRVAIRELIHMAREKITVIMCAEVLPMRCHRSLVSDALIARGWDVFDIFNIKTVTPHFLTSFAQVEGKEITYPQTMEVKDGDISNGRKRSRERRKN